MERILRVDEAASAAQIQAAIDEVAQGGGGRVVLPAMDLELDRGLALRSGIELCGQGPDTILRKGPGRIYPFSGYHNYGMCDAPLLSTEGLDVGMTVSLHDGRTHGGFYETFATITWIEGDWVGLDHGIEADYRAEDAPCLTTVYPLVFAHDARQIALRDMHLEGNRAAQEKGMGGCRGSAVYFARSRDIEVSNVSECDYHGEGLGFQMCRDVQIIDCRFDGNSGNGLHPGAGSTNACFAGCVADNNDKAGFFFCVRANHITVADCSFRGNRLGMSIGTRDCHNAISGCTLENNRGPGVLVRKSPRPVEVHSIRIERCRVSGNAAEEGRGQIELTSDAHDLVVRDCEIGGGACGIYVEETVGGVYLADNRIDCATSVQVDVASIAAVCPELEVGYGTADESIFLHLPVRV
jgi:hypothetical protein